MESDENPFAGAGNDEGVFCVQESKQRNQGGGFGGNVDFGSESNSLVTESDFSSLIDLIRETVDADAWEETGSGIGTIQPFPANITCMIAGPPLKEVNFFAISHSFWALLIGWCVGHSSKYIHDRSTNSRS